jgi:hypothetical protein
VALAVSLVADAVLIQGEQHATPLWGSGLAGYWPVFAVFWFLVFVFGSKWIGAIGVAKREDYYEEDDA